MKSIRMPDLLTLQTDPDTKQHTAQVGTCRVEVQKFGRRETDSLTDLVISTSDLRTLVKAAAGVGWDRHVEHVRQLEQQKTASIGD